MYHFYSFVHRIQYFHPADRCRPLHPLALPVFLLLHERAGWPESKSPEPPRGGRPMAPSRAAPCEAFASRGRSGAIHGTRLGNPKRTATAVLPAVFSGRRLTK